MKFFRNKEVEPEYLDMEMPLDPILGRLNLSIETERSEIMSLPDYIEKLKEIEMLNSQQEGA